MWMDALINVVGSLPSISEHVHIFAIHDNN